MEDGIERSKVNYEEEESKREKYVYIFLPSNGNYIIFFDKDKAIEYSKKNNCRVDIFNKDTNKSKNKKDLYEAIIQYF